MWMVFFKKVLPLMLVQVFQQLGYIPSARIQMTRAYLRGVQALRWVFLAMLGLGLLFVLSVLALVCLLLGVYQWFSHDPRLLAVVMLSAGSVLILFIGTLLVWMSSEKRWMQRTGAMKLLERSLQDLEQKSPSLWENFFVSTNRSSRSEAADSSRKKAA
jgi:hypothetical protein